MSGFSNVTINASGAVLRWPVSLPTVARNRGYVGSAQKAERGSRRGSKTPLRLSHLAPVPKGSSSEFSVLGLTDWRTHACDRATLRRNRTKRTDELTRKVGESLTPRLRKLEGFGGYYLIEAEEGVWSAVNFYDTSAHADESTRVVAEWLREEKLEEALPNPPKITDGTVIVQEL